MAKSLLLLICLAVWLVGCKPAVQKPEASTSPATSPDLPTKKPEREWRLSPVNGESLVNDCSSNNATLTVLCTSYLVGSLDMLDSLMFTAKANVPAVTCVPTDVTGGQMAKVVIKYGKDHPENLHVQGSAFVIQAFGQAWPCN